MTSLVHLLVKPIDDISLIYVDVEDSNRVDGVQTVDLYITNNSQNCIEKFNLKVEDLNGQVYFDDEIYYTLNSGETTRVTQEVKIGKLVQQTDFNVTVKTDSEVDLSDNSLTVSLGYINVGMTADRYENSNTLIMSVNVYNKSYTPADITINLIEDKIDGITIDMKNIACHEFAERQGWTITKEYSEKGISGFKVSAEDRDAIQDLKTAALNKEFDVLLVFMFDRIGRIDDETPFVVEWFVHHGIEVWSVKEGEYTADISKQKTPARHLLKVFKLLMRTCLIWRRKFYSRGKRKTTASARLRLKQRESRFYQATYSADTAAAEWWLLPIMRNM